MLGADNEIWKDIKGYEGLYQVSNLGRVKSLKKWDVNKKMLVNSERIMALTDNGYGYLIVSLVKDCKRKNKYIHRLVAEAFVDNPLCRRYVNHLDYDKKNNLPCNLEWCTQKENVGYSSERMKKPKTKATSNTGELYISQRKRDGLYRVAINHKEYGRYATLSQAIYKRNKFLEEIRQNV